MSEVLPIIPLHAQIVSPTLIFYKWQGVSKKGDRIRVDTYGPAEVLDVSQYPSGTSAVLLKFETLTRWFAYVEL